MSFSKAMDDYVQVKDRIKEFRDKNGIDLGLESELLHHDDKSCTFKATIKDQEGFIIATGHAHEKVSDNVNVNVTSMIENCETSAWGRALANFGCQISKSIASREEVRHLGPKAYTGDVKQKAILSRVLRSLKVQDKEVAQNIQDKLIEDEIMDDELSITKFVKGIMND